jgi:acetyltransferase-like isoleucine patch superfamily enzyme
MMRRALRVAWTIATLIAVEAIVCGLALLPVAAAWGFAFRLIPARSWLAVLLIAAGAAPSYVAAALALMPLSAAAARLLGWRTRPGLAMRIADAEWPLLDWARGAAVNHLVALAAGSLFHGSPVWSWYLRLNGARVGRRVFVNSLGVADHALLEFGDDVVVGAGAHVSGHTVEGGLVKTAGIRLGRGVTVGIGAIVEIGVTAGDQCVIGALTFVPKHERLKAHAIYAGVPARRIDRDGDAR